MVTPAQHAAELDRIEFLISRDGREAAGIWVRTTLDIYRHAVADRHSHAGLPQYRPLFDDSIGTFESWLQRSGAPAPE